MRGISDGHACTTNAAHPACGVSLPDDRGLFLQADLCGRRGSGVSKPQRRHPVPRPRLALTILAALFATYVRRGGSLALSGILQGQETELLACYAQWFDDLRVAVREGWVRITGKRRVEG